MVYWARAGGVPIFLCRHGGYQGRKNALAGGAMRQLSDRRDVMGQLKQMWEWEDTETGMIRTADGPLCLLHEGRSAVKQVAVRAWADWLWLGESRVRRDEDYKERWQGLEPDAEAHRE